MRCMLRMERGRKNSCDRGTHWMGWGDGQCPKEFYSCPWVPASCGGSMTGASPVTTILRLELARLFTVVPGLTLSLIIRETWWRKSIISPKNCIFRKFRTLGGCLKMHLIGDLLLKQTKSTGFHVCHGWARKVTKSIFLVPLYLNSYYIFLII